MNRTITLGVESEVLVFGWGWSSKKFFRAAGQDPRFDEEAVDACVEVKTEVHGTVSSLIDDLRLGLLQVSELILAQGVIPLPIALHPLETRSRLSGIGKSLAQWRGAGIAAAQNCCGTQISLGVGSGDALLYLGKALRPIGPLLTAITANSPFLGGRPSGLLATRPAIRRMLMDAGIPEEIREKSWGAYARRRMPLCDTPARQGFMSSLRKTNNADLRLRPEGWRLEVCSPEVIPTLEATEALAVFLRGLALRVLEHYDEGAPLRSLTPFLGSQLSLAIQHGMSEACREGTKGLFAIRGERLVSIEEALTKLFDWVHLDSRFASILLSPSPAQRMLTRFSEIHSCRKVGGCRSCAGATAEIVQEFSGDFLSQLRRP